MKKYVLLLVSSFFAGSFSANAMASTASLQTCYTSAYKTIFTNSLPVSKNNYPFNKMTQDEYEALLNGAAFYAAVANGVFNQVERQDQDEVVVYKVESPENLLGIKKDQRLTLAGVDRSIGKAAFAWLGIDAAPYTPDINRALGNGSLSNRIKALPECAGAF